MAAKSTSKLAVSDEDLQKKELEKADTHQTDGMAVDNALMENVKAQWKGDLATTIAQEQYKGINWSDKWLKQFEDIKDPEEMKEKFAHGVVSGLAFAA